MTISLLLYVAAVILLVLAAIGVADRVKLIAAGLACGAVGLLLQYVV